MLASILSNKARVEAVILICVCLTLWGVAVYFDLFEVVTAYVLENAVYELDELILALFFGGLGGFVFASLRAVDLRRALVAQQMAERDATWLALHDPLTRLGNRAGLEQAMADIEQAAAGTRHIVHSIDLDGFKKINDMLGHETGDMALFEAASRLAAVYGDMPLFRVGGDEFVALQPSDDEQRAKRLAEGAINALSAHSDLLDGGGELGASIGTALAGAGEGALRTALQHADAALYVAKRSGRNQMIRFEDSMNQALRRRIELERELRQALRDGSVRPHFQPLIDLKSKKVRGFEALARWHSSSGESVPPAEFVALAEETGLIIELGEQLLRRACLEAAKWPLDVTLAFNISPVQFRDQQLGLRIMQILGETGLTPQRLEVEITETALMHDPSQAERVLASLHAAGIRVALDDFGTGYSSLSQLSRFRFDKIKIDRSFVVGFETDEKQAKIMRALLGLGHGLGLTTTAEGIESESQLKTLTELGCDVGQGFLFGKALPAEAALALLRADDLAELELAVRN